MFYCYPFTSNTLTSNFNVIGTLSPFFIQVSSYSYIITLANKIQEKVADGKYSSHSLDEVAGMIRNTLSAYESKVKSFT